VQAIILDGSAPGDPTAAAIREAAVARFESAGFAVTRYFLPEITIAPCVGDFRCWTSSPGVCGLVGPNREIARDVARGDLLLLLTPITFGGYSSELKKALDHLIPNILPILSGVGDETHHPMRYDRAPALAAFGILPGRDQESERIFETLVHRNAINMHPPARVSGVFFRSGDPDGIPARVRELLGRVGVGS
jgi:multimeric flavodoxin WrbA